MSKVVVSIAPTQSKNNPEWGYVQLAQDKSSIEGNFLRKRRATCIINGPLEDLKASFSAGMELEGQIIAKESLTPVNPDDLSQGVKMAGDSGIACTVGGKPVYRTTEFTTDLSATDELVKHDNGEAISAFYAEQREAEEAKLNS